MHDLIQLLSIDSVSPDPCVTFYITNNNYYSHIANDWVKKCIERMEFYEEKKRYQAANDFGAKAGHVEVTSA